MSLRFSIFASGTACNDFGTGDFAASIIEPLYADGITTGCGNGNYCPDNPVTSTQKVVSLVRTFGQLARVDMLCRADKRGGTLDASYNSVI